MEEYPEATPEEKLRIASHFILNSPNGEVDDVIADVKTLMGKKSLLTDDVIVKLLKQYNINQCVFAPRENGNNAMVCDFSHKDDMFLVPDTAETLPFDHQKRVWDESKAQKASSSSAETYRKAIEEQASDYMKNFYLNKKDYALAVFDLGNDTVAVVISAKRVNLSNYWSGGWQAVYKLDLSKKDADVPLTASIVINVHYFEEGNVQLNSKHEPEVEVAVGDPETTAKNVMKKIQELENGFQKKMEEMYLNMNTQTFKAMRRFLPITKTKMDWNPNAHRIASNINTS